MARLDGTIAIVSGASRGAGRGIAVVLGSEGATVYVTGRSSRSTKGTEDLPGTIEDTAEEVSARGGNGIAVRCDHTDEADLRCLFDQVQKEYGKLDLLVNNAWGGYEGYTHGSFGERFWEQPLTRWTKMATTGIWSPVATTYFAVPLLLRSARGLVINTGFLAGWDDWETPKNNPLFYDVQKVALNRATLGIADELREHNIAVVGLGLGWMRTERIMRDTPPKPEDLPKTASTEFGGRAVVALACDPRILEKSRQFLGADDLAREFGFTDTDGS
jgi:NAD(P)-dependent dehydrogenase (short-subunit alcohol dehydrogenase family)